MKTQDFERYLKTFVNRAEQKEQQFDNLTKDEKIEYLLSVMDINPAEEVVTTTKEVEISKLSKDVRFAEIQKASIKGDLALVQNLALGIGSINLEVTTTFERATQTAQLDHLTKIHIERVGSLPNAVVVDVLGGENFKKFVEYCYNQFYNQKN